jgi:hypothetical protein
MVLVTVGTLVYDLADGEFGYDGSATDAVVSGLL